MSSETVTGAASLPAAGGRSGGESLGQDLASVQRALDQRIKELAVVNAIAGVVAHSPEITDILEQSLRRLIEVMELEAGAVFLLDEDGEHLVRIASIGFSPQFQRALRRLRVGEHLTGQVAEHGEPIYVDDISKDPRISAIVMKGEGVRSFAGLPLRSRGRLLGVMIAVSREYRPFGASDAGLLGTIGHQLAVAVDNAQLFVKNSRLLLLEERHWLAREIHDTVAQGLVALTLQLELAIAQLKEERDLEKAGALMGRALALARESLEEARRSVMHLRGDRATNLGLGDALQALVADFSQETGVRGRAVVSKRVGPLPVNMEEGIYRIAQEALMNVRTHAQARNVRVTLQRKTGQVELSVRDDGVGFDPRQGPPPGHFGVLGMGERASLLGGRLDLQSSPGQGTLVKATIPIREARVAAASG